MRDKLLALVLGASLVSCHESIKFRPCIDDGEVYSGSDLTGDGNPDFVMKRGDWISIVPGGKDGVCMLPIRLAEIRNVTDVKVYDANRDGLADIVVSHKDHWYSLSQRASVLENQGYGKFKLKR